MAASVEAPNVPVPGPSTEHDHSKLAIALYNHCRQDFAVGDVLTQPKLLAAKIIPDNDVKILLGATTYLVEKRLFKIHRISKPHQEQIGWELVSEQRAENYHDLTRDESLILQIVDSSGSSGLWTKSIRDRSNMPSKYADKILKSLESKKRIIQIRAVQHPGRKTFIVAGLTPAERVIGGAWFTDGNLDEELIESVANVIETYVAKASWREVVNDEVGDDVVRLPTKRKQPEGGFDEKGKGPAKIQHIEGERTQFEPSEFESQKSRPKHSPKKSFLPYQAGYEKYPMLDDICAAVVRSKISNTLLPNYAIEELLQVMVYDDRLYTIQRSLMDPENPDPVDIKQIMYRTLHNPEQVSKRFGRLHKMRNLVHEDSARRAMMRELELEDLAYGGVTEVPCLRCPVSHLCEDEGPISAKTCEYLDVWLRKMDTANDPAVKIEVQAQVVGDSVGKIEHENGSSKQTIVID